MRNILRDKRGEDIFYPVVIFVLLNLVFFGSMIFFVVKSSSGALVYEQAYAKEIALLIDSSEPLSEVRIDFEKGLEIAKKNEVENIDSLVSVENGRVTVRLDDNGGYYYDYFTDYNVEVNFEENFVVLTIDEKNGD